MEYDQQHCTLDEWMSPYTQSIPVDSSSTLFPRYFTLPDLSPPTNSQTSSNHPSSVGLSIEMERSPWNSIGGKSLGPLSCIQPLLSTAAHMCIDHIQLFPSPCSDHCPDINARFAHDPMIAISSLSRDSYSAIQGQFCNAPWRCAGELEPKDPTTGRSVLYALLEERASGNKRSVECRLCNRVFTRADRAITHLRHKHLDHRPFRCGGACGTKGWYEDFRCVILGPI